MIRRIEQAMAGHLRQAVQDGRLPYRLTIVTGGGTPFAPASGWTDFPLAWIVFAGTNTPWRLGKSFRIPVRFLISAAALPLAYESLHRDEDPRQPGAYRLVADIQRLLTGQQWDLDILPLEPWRVTPLSVPGSGQILPPGPGQVLPNVYTAEFRTSYDIAPEPTTGAIADFQGATAQWQLNPSSPVPSPAP